MQPKTSRVDWVKVVLVETTLILLAVLLLVLSEYPGNREGFLLPLWVRTLSSVAASIVGVSLAADIIYRVCFAPAEKTDRIAEIRQIVQQAFERQYTLENEYGLVDFRASIDFAALFDELHEGDELWWHDTFGPNLAGYESNLVKSLERGVSIQMLVQNPNCQNARFRAQEIQGFFNEKNYIAELTRFRDHVAELASRFNGSGAAGLLNVRQYDDLPSIPMYIVCRGGAPIRGYSSFFLTVPTGIKCPHLVWGPSRADTLQQFLGYVKQKWGRARPIPDLS